jgi:hypothetical protein
MTTKTQELQRWIRQYRQETGIKEVDNRELAVWLKAKGWPMPKPQDPVDLLARQLSEASRLEIRVDEVTGRDYRAYHCFEVTQPNGKQLHLWVDIDEAKRPQMWKALINKRDQMAGEAVRMADDQDHWNRKNPDQEPIAIPLDFGPDVEWSRNAPGDDEKKAS